MSRFTERVAVVTGAASGIGRALAYQLAGDGAILAISDVDEVGLAETAAHVRGVLEHSGSGFLGAAASVRSDVLDVTDRAAMIAYAASVAEEFGSVHLVINNAGLAHTGDILDLEFAEIERVMDVDFWGVVNGTKAFLPYLIASGDGNLANVSSLFGLISMPSQGAYNSAKFAVRGFTEALRIEMLVAGHPVKVSCVHPGGVKTAIARNATVSRGLDQAATVAFFEAKMARMGPTRAASIILRGVAAGRPRVLVGADAWAFHLLGILGGTAYQRMVAAGARRMAPGRRRSSSKSD